MARKGKRGVSSAGNSERVLAPVLLRPCRQAQRTHTHHPAPRGATALAICFGIHRWYVGSQCGCHERVS
eukprot:2342900-Alexandrium_andersonii.AAC.1